MHLRFLNPLVLLLLPALTQAQNCNPGIPETTPDNRFDVHMDAVVVDNSTGLIWSRCMLGQPWDGKTCAPPKAVATFRDWAGAINSVSRITLAGFDDWRLPTLKELRTLVEQRCKEPSINSRIFPETSPAPFWTLDSYLDNHEYAWRISFDDGNENADLKFINSYRVRMVRGQMKPQISIEDVIKLEPVAMDSDELRKERLQLRKLWQDGIHDITNPDIIKLQNPDESMSGFTRNQWGRVDWVSALQSGEIIPKTGYDNDQPMLELELDILLKDTGQMDYVKFPHKQHSQWLACSNCHTRLFPYKAGVVNIRMDDVLNGKYCGMCHGKVAFSPMLCERCHSVPKQSPVKIAE
ncbi:MAG: DUF1566 domain-containing protein [Gammaproteobacteria bacterium]|nr:DUF1566 domain-containing protein [Gammaproteobacteria bacterium]MBL7001083.1 DUF1566 domain-containing protein [Gammaproteobacteria bacterium]